MASSTITKRSVDALQPQDRDAFLWDDGLRGFGVKVTPAGAKSYIYAYRLGGREATKRRYTIGRHGSPWTPTTARQRAEQLALLVAQGVDPLTAERERREEATTLDFVPYAERFIAEYLTPEWPGSWQTYASILRDKAMPAFARKTVRTINRADVARLMSSLADRPALRRNTYAILRRLFRWAVGRGDLERSPIQDMEPPPAPETRDRVMTDAEIGLVWRAADAIGYPFGPMFQLLAATGQRREEVAALEWRELDQADLLWTLPAARSKNKQAHLVPINQAAWLVLEQIARAVAGVEIGPVRWPRTGFVLTTSGKAPVSGYSKAKARLDAMMAEIAGEAPQPWRTHDLRRTLATGLQRLGVRFEVTEAVLNHTSGARSGVAGIYQRHDWKVEKREALAAWSNAIQTTPIGGVS